MNRVVVRLLVGLWFIVGLASHVLAQGVYWEAKRSGGMMGDRVAVDKMYYMSKKFKSEPGSGGQSIILRLDKEVMNGVDSNAKTYWEVTFAEMGGMMKKAGSKMDAAMAEMQKKLQEMPEEKRKMVEQMMKGRMPGQEGDSSSIEVTKTDDKKTISGYSCTKFTLTRDGKELLSVWATKEVKAFEPMRKDFEEFQKRMMELNSRVPKGLAEGMKKIEGFPIETDMPGGMTQVVTKIEKRSISASEFDIPSGYTKVKPPMMGEKSEEKGEE